MGTENHQTEVFYYDNNKKSNEIDVKNNSESQNADEQKCTNFKMKKLNNDDIPNISITINENNVVDGAKEVLKIIRTDWNLNNVKFKFFTDGITNKLVGCFHDKSQLKFTSSSSSSSETVNNCNNSSDDLETNNTENGALCGENNIDIVLIRVYGNNTELLINRKAEQYNIRLLHTYGFAPSLFATFKNGLAYEYVPGCTLTPSTVIQPKIWTLIAQRMAEMHKVKSKSINSNNCGAASSNQCYNNYDIDNEPMLWKKTQTMLDLIPEKFSDTNKNERVSQIFSSIKTLRNQFEDLYKILEKLNSPLVFAHNDLLLGNVIYNENLNRVTFIDYEYAAVNFQGFDIGNHFTEFTGIEVDEIDYSRYPSKEFQIKWLNVYLRNYLEIDDNEDVPEKHIEELYIHANQFALASHLFWAIWGLVQAENSTIDFNFIK